RAHRAEPRGPRSDPVPRNRERGRVQHHGPEGPHGPRRVMSALIRVAILPRCVACLACGQPSRPSAGEANGGIDSLNQRIVQAYRTHDPQAYAALYTDTAVFEWPAFNTVRGPAQLAAMARSNWASLKDMDLRLTVSARRVAPDHAMEFGARSEEHTSELQSPYDL